MDALALIVLFLVLGALVSLGLVLWFLWKVYDRGGLAHLVRTCKALRDVYDPEWASKLMKYLPRVRKDEGDDEEERHSA